jgi:hypothetical protein
MLYIKNYTVKWLTGPVLMVLQILINRYYTYTMKIGTPLHTGYWHVCDKTLIFYMLIRKIYNTDARALTTGKELRPKISLQVTYLATC